MTCHPEFTDYPLADLPAIPQGFVDTSWHNDTCPSYMNEATGVRIFLDYVDLTKREWTDPAPRFNVYRDDVNGGMEPIFSSDNWADVLSFVASKA